MNAIACLVYLRHDVTAHLDLAQLAYAQSAAGRSPVDPTSAETYVKLVSYTTSATLENGSRLMTNLQRFLKLVAPVAAIAFAATVLDAPSAGAQGPGLPLSKCFDAVGTYLTTNYAKDESGKFISRSLVSLTNGGHAFFTDSGEAGEPGFGPFSDGRGAWRCVSNEKGVTRFLATVLDFTFITPGFPKQLIGRLDIDASFDAAAEKLSGTMTLYLVPIDGDPLNQSNLKEGATGKFEAQKVIAP